MSSYNWKPSPTQTTTPPHIPHLITKIWPNLFSLVRFSSRRCCFIVNNSTRMFYQKRHSFSEPTSFLNWKIYWLQQYYGSTITLW
uniref:Uncharacterized protein n=1 Tax=Medicago truncatula TaxID=3880 RepID=I3S7E0_MEDTR|nr:unknown [Medicago truncatula]